MQDNSYEVSSPDIVAELFADEVVVLNLENGKYFSLRGLSAKLWSAVTAGHAPRQIHQHLQSIQHQQADACLDFIQSLIDENLIRITKQLVTAGNNEMGLDDYLPLNAADEMQAPALEIYDDMAELILSDPIHEVDEDVGWPRKRDS